MKIYISGKIEGDSNYKEKFRFAEDALKSMFPNGTILNPANAPKGLSNGTYMRLALAQIDESDFVCFLPDWERSAGAKLEKLYCEYIGKPIFGWGY